MCQGNDIPINDLSLGDTSSSYSVLTQPCLWASISRRWLCVLDRLVEEVGEEAVPDCDSAGL